MSAGLYRVTGATGVKSLTLDRRSNAPLTTIAPTQAPRAGAAKTRTATAMAPKSRPPLAKAATNYGYDGKCIPVGQCSPRWFSDVGDYSIWWDIFEIDGWSYDPYGRNICLNAQNPSGAWAGVGVCGGAPIHQYNGSYRRGWAMAQGGGNQVYGSASELYYCPCP
jgi:hypothetical protein